MTLAASGMLLYAGVNSLAWSEVKNNRIFAGIFGTAAVIALLAIIYYVFVY